MQQQQQLQRHVCNMLPNTAINATVKLLMLIAVTISLLLVPAGVKATAIAFIPPPTLAKPALTTARATPTGFQSVADLQAIGATALAAVVAAENHLLDTSRSSSSRSIIADDVIIAAQSANLLLEEMQHPGQVVNLTRYYDGDIFRTNGVTNCNADTCVGLSSGTAGLVHVGGTKNDRSVGTGIGTVGHLGGRLGTKRGKLAVDSSIGNSCDCRCLPYLRTYREDLGICVDDIHECTLSPFVSGSSAEKIPYVFLPLRGQIIYPSREISFPDIRTPVCAVTGAQYLTSNGWTDLRNPIDTDYPFRMFRDEGRSFLQWLGEADLRKKMQGRLIVVHLVCRDMMLSLNATKIKDQLKPPKNVFSPCVAFRVNGSPVKYFHNVSEVLFQSEATSTLAATSDGMTTKEYVVIGVCSLLLGLIYVSSVFLYLHMKKRKTSDQSQLRSSLDDLANEINYPKNDQVTFGAPFTRSGSTYSAASLTTLNEPRSRNSISSAVSVHLKEEMGIVKNNPLLQHFPQLNDIHHHHHHSGFTSDISNSNSECETDGGGGGGGFHDKLKQSLFKQLQTSALVHPPSGGNGGGVNGGGNGVNATSTGQSGSPGSSGSRKGSESPAERPSSPTQESECLPEENVSIVEDMMTEEKIEQMRQMVNGTIRRKLFFNPAYFEPHLLAQPPPAAIEFLTKIREVIAIAKYKMATKRYQPSLIMIPEEAPLGSTTPSLYSSQLQMSGADGCRGCATNRCTGHAKNCGDKRNSIEKWLQTVAQTDGQKSANGQSTQSNQSNAEEKMERNNSNDQQESTSTQQQQEMECRQSPTEQRSNRSSNQQKIITQPRQRPPPPPPKPSSSGSSKHSSSPKAHIIEIRHSEPFDYPNNASPENLSTTITVNNRNYDAYTALSTAAHIYGFAEMGGEIYNNPKFILHDSPVGSQRSHCSSHRSKTSRKRLDVLDQYAAASTPTSLTSADREHYEMLRNMKQMPDLGFDTLPRDYNNTLASSNGSYHLDIPTPDYDSTMEKKIKDIYSNNTMQSSAPSVPTPDYSTLSKKSLRQFQPDSPIYRRKSPQYLIVDYETDSLERMNVTKRKSSQSSSSPSSDVSSQLSPSLSTALPLEEEVEISHAVYDKVNGLRKDGNTKKKLISKAEKNANKLKEMEARIKYDTPFLGSMTIEVAHEPPSDLELSTDSEQFDADTLDRKQKRHSFCDVNAWSEHLKKAQHFVNSSADCLNDDEPVTYQSLGNMNALTGTNKPLQPDQSIRCSQKSRTVSNSNPIYMHNIVNECSHMRAVERSESQRSSFDSIRDIYHTQIMRRNSQSSQGSRHSCCSQNPEKSHDECCNEKGRILTLEAKHSRRQRIIETARVEPPEIETEVVDNKTTIKIKTPNINRPLNNCSYVEQSKRRESREEDTFPNSDLSKCNQPKGFYDLAKNLANWGVNSTNQATASNRELRIEQDTLFTASKKRSPPTPPPPPPPSSTSTTMNSHRSNNSSQRHFRQYHNNHEHATSGSRHYQNQTSSDAHQSTTGTEETAEETASNHSESTEITGVSDTLANSEFDCSCNNTLNSAELKSDTATEPEIQSTKYEDSNEPVKSRCNSVNSPQLDETNEDKLNSPTAIKKVFADKLDSSSGDILSAAYNGLRNDYSLNKYLNRRKSQDHVQDESSNKCLNDTKPEANNNNGKLADSDPNKVDVISISSRSNRSSSRLSDRTKEMYRNAGVPVGIAYPQRSSANNSSSNSTTNVQTVYRCEIEPVQLTHGMQIAMGLKDRAKKAKDLKNAWKKFVSMAASKFSPTASPAPPFEKKNTASFLESLERDEGISSLIDEHPQVSTPKSSYSAPPSQNYYEQRFGSARLQELDSGYMSADSSEVYKRSFYDRYNFRMMSGKNRVIRVDTIEDHSDGSTASTERNMGSNGSGGLGRKSSLIDSNRFEDFEHMGDPPPSELRQVELDQDASDAESDKTLTRGSERQVTRRPRGPQHLYSSEDEQGHSPSYGSSETDGETNAEDMWESGAESIETHSVLYKKVRKN